MASDVVFHASDWCWCPSWCCHITKAADRAAVAALCLPCLAGHGLQVKVGSMFCPCKRTNVYGSRHFVLCHQHNKCRPPASGAQPETATLLATLQQLRCSWIGRCLVVLGHAEEENQGARYPNLLLPEGFVWFCMWARLTCAHDHAVFEATDFSDGAS